MTISQNKSVWIINQYASTPYSGVGGRHYAFAKELSKKGYNVHLISAAFSHILKYPPNLQKTYRIDNQGSFNFVWVNVPKYSSAHSAKRILNWFLFAFRLPGLSRAICDKPDVILYSSPSLIGFLGARKIARQFDAKLVFEVRDIWPLTLIELGNYSPQHLFIRFLQWIEDKAYKESDAVISNLKFSVEHMVERGLQRSKFTWIPNGFSLSEQYNKSKLSDDVIAKFPKNKFLVGYTGTLGLANGLNYLIEAASLCSDNTDIAFVIIGDGRDRENLMKLVELKKLSNVHILGSIPKNQVQSALSLLNACYIGLTKDPLFRYGVSPNKLFDYFYSAKPIIYSIDSGDYQPVREAGAGIQVVPESPEAIRKAVFTLYNLTPEERLKMGENGKSIVLSQYNYEKLTPLLESVLSLGK